jgi:exopolyphosphatase
MHLLDDSTSNPPSVTVNVTENGNNKDGYLSFTDFLKKQKANPSSHIVIGNEAGDADSIISSIVMAYVLSAQSPTMPVTPIISITKNDLETQRPETVVLLRQLAGIDTEKDLCYIDEFKEQSCINTKQSNYDVTLVDHNQLNDAALPKNIQWNVISIYDHHIDLGKYLDTCHIRKIEFDNNKASVASTCTIIVEEIINNNLQRTNNNLLPPELSILLLGVILLDSVNMDPNSGKGTDRDQVAIEFLLNNTQWDTLPSLQHLSLLDHGKLDTLKLFNILQKAKFAPEFWSSLSVRDCLRLDYKNFGNGSISSNSGFGVSTVLLPLSLFQEKELLTESLYQYMKEMQVIFLGIMFAFEDPTSSKLKRQLMLCGKDGFPLNNLVSFLKDDGSLQLEDISSSNAKQSSGISTSSFVQGTAEASRKQVAPILTQFFEKYSSSL